MNHVLALLADDPWVQLSGSTRPSIARLDAIVADGGRGVERFGDIACVESAPGSRCSVALLAQTPARQSAISSIRTDEPPAPATAGLVRTPSRSWT